jgi:hypothetical protein
LGKDLDYSLPLLAPNFKLKLGANTGSYLQFFVIVEVPEK